MYVHVYMYVYVYMYMYLCMCVCMSMYMYMYMYMYMSTQYAEIHAHTVHTCMNTNVHHIETRTNHVCLCVRACTHMHKIPLKKFRKMCGGVKLMCEPRAT